MRSGLPVVAALAALPLAACGTTTTSVTTGKTASQPQSQAYPAKAQEAYLKAYKHKGIERLGACILRKAEGTLSYAQFEAELEHEKPGPKVKAITKVCLAEALVAREGVGAPKTIRPTGPHRPNP